MNRDEFWHTLIEKLSKIVNADNGNILTQGNIRSIGPRNETDPRLIHLGEDDDHVVYLFFQKRPPHQGSKFWAGLRTFMRLPNRPVAEGYGALPLLIQGQGIQMRADGTLVVRNLVAENIYLQTPAYRAPDGQMRTPSYYDAQGIPHIVINGVDNVMGGIDVANDLSVRLSRLNDGAGLYINDMLVESWPK